MTDTTKNNVPDGFILLQTQNGAPKYAACMTGRLAGWLMKKYPDGNWVSERKLTNLEVMQAEDQRDDGIVHETPAATTQEPVMVAEPVACKTCGGAGIVDDGEINCFPNGTPYENGPIKCVKDCPACKSAAPMVADPAGVAGLKKYRVLDEFSMYEGNDWNIDDCVIPADGYWVKLSDVESLLAATVKAVPSEALDESNRAGWFIWEHGCWVATSSDDPRATKLYRAAPLADKTGGVEHG